MKHVQEVLNYILPTLMPHGLHTLSRKWVVQKNGRAYKADEPVTPYNDKIEEVIAVETFRTLFGYYHEKIMVYMMDQYELRLNTGGINETTCPNSGKIGVTEEKIYGLPQQIDYSELLGNKGMQRLEGKWVSFFHGHPVKKRRCAANTRVG